MYRTEIFFGEKMIRRLADNVIIPVDPPKEIIDENGDSYFVGGNVDYVEYLNWINSGNTPEEINITPTPTASELRKQAYDIAGCDANSLIVALWELVVEDRPESANALQAKRLEVKDLYPKN